MTASAADRSPEQKIKMTVSERTAESLAAGAAGLARQPARHQRASGDQRRAGAGVRRLVQHFGTVHSEMDHKRKEERGRLCRPDGT